VKVDWRIEIRGAVATGEFGMSVRICGTFVGVVLIGVLCSSMPVCGGDLGQRTSRVWETVEWRIDGIGYQGNPFDVSARVTFEHRGSGEKRTTEMFYDGQRRWKFRFTGTRTGQWTFGTSSGTTGLNGHRGTVSVEANMNSKIKGYVGSAGNKFTVQCKDGSDVRGYIFNVYMSRIDHAAFLDEFGADPGEAEKKTRAYFADAMANGFEIIFIHVNNNWFKLGARKHSEHRNENPDPAAFEILERIIGTVHRLGGRVHIWAWGDESRKWTPRGLPGGINGEADRRVQRYIAARLGPMPGWTMGYGFDLHEWVKGEQVNSWADYLHEHFGWQHLLCARGQRLKGEGNMHSYDGFGRGVALTTTSHGPADYSEIAEDLDGDKNRVHFYEERHSFRRSGFKLDMEGTRRLLWWETMAGGMGGFFGFYPDSAHPYPNPEQLRTHYRFWHDKGRFLLDMERANGLSDAGYVLKSADKKHYVFYEEDASSVRMDLSGMAGSQPAVAVDTKAEYKEIEVGALGARVQNWKPPYRSDWAIAVGSFAGGQAVSGPRGNPRPPSKSPGGHIVVDPKNRAWLKRVGGGGFFMCGPGDPEGFLYRGTMKADGTRDGDQMELIDKMKGTGANCIYLMAVRSHGGDGERTHNPFLGNDPGRGINSKVLDQWERWFVEMDKNGIVIYFFFYDDGTRPWGRGKDDAVGDAEREFVRAIVNRFEHHRNLIWCIAEEYQEGLSVKRVKNIAAAIRAPDDYGHAIAVHKLNGLDFSEFADDRNIDQFAIQYNAKTAEELHRGMVRAWEVAKGRYSLNMSEAKGFGGGRSSRLKSWACAMGGAYVMILDMDIAGTPRSDLEDCGRLVRFFESTNFNEMAPHDELALGGTKYVLAKPGESYIAYAAEGKSKIGLEDMKGGRYDVRWFDCVTGKEVLERGVKVEAGDWSRARPKGIGSEVAVHVRRSTE